MPGPEDDATPPPELPEAVFDARIAELGVMLTPAERANALRTARTLHRAAALVRAYAAATEDAEA